MSSEEIFANVVTNKIVKATARAMDHVTTIEMMIMEKITGKVMLLLDDPDFMEAVKQDIIATLTNYER